MHYFINYQSLLLLPSTSKVNFGPISGDETNKYNCTAQFTLAAESPAFACQEGLMIVQESSANSDYVNIILKPSSGLTIPSPSVKYYVYRGLLKSSFVSGTDIVPQNSSTKSEFIKAFWENWNEYKAFINQPNLSDPGPESFGFDNSLPGTTKIEDIFNYLQTDVYPVFVKEATWIGNFNDADTIGFEVITETEHLDLDLDYLRKNEHIVDITALASISPATPESLFNLRAKKEEILSFIDPAAFWGLHYRVGVSKSIFTGSNKETEPIREFSLFLSFVEPFGTNLTIYIDIRSEFGYSFNFYQNYLLDNIQIDADLSSVLVPQEYSTHGWPILILNSTQNTKSEINFVDIQLLIEDNSEPLVFNPGGYPNSFTNPQFLSGGRLVTSILNQYTNSIRFPFINDGVPAHLSSKDAISSYVKVYYFRQKNNTSSPASVFQIENPLNKVFGSLQLPLLTGASSIFYQSKSSKPRFIIGQGYSYVAFPQSYQDDDVVVYFSEKEYADEYSNDGYPIIRDSQNSFAKSPFLNKDTKFKLSRIQENIGTPSSPVYQDVYILDLLSYSKNNTPSNLEDIFVLGITKSQHDQLVSDAAAASLSANHGIFIAFEVMGLGLLDKDDLCFNKYKLKIHGLDADGVYKVIQPSSDIFVYTYSTKILASKEFTILVDIPNSKPHPGFMRQWDYVGKWYYKNLLTSLTPVIDNFNNGGILDPEIQITGFVFFPTDLLGITDPADISNRETNYPLIAIIHGNGQYYYEYDELAEHLARNGFIVASIECMMFKNKFELKNHSYFPGKKMFIADQPYVYDPGSNFVYKVDSETYQLTLMTWSYPTNFTISGNYIVFDTNSTPNVHGMSSIGRSATLFKHLKEIKVKFGSKMQDKIGLMGHSRGGEAVVTAERLLNSQTDVSGLDIGAIISLAPTDQYVIETLSNDIPYLVIYGSHDTDVSSAAPEQRRFPNTSQQIVVSYTGFPLWDRAYGQDKTMAYFSRATHNGFITSNNRDPFDDQIDTIKGPNSVLMPDEIQRLIAKSFMNAFYRSHLKYENYWNGIFKGEWLPDLIDRDKTKIQFKTKESNKLIVENFDGSPVDTDLSDGEATGIMLKEPSWTNPLDSYSPHGTAARLIDLSHQTNSLRVTTIYSSSTPLNISPYQYLSFRVAKVPDSDFFFCDSLSIQINQSVHILDFNSIQIHEKAKVPSMNMILTKSAMETVRVPLNEFNGLDKSNVILIELRFFAFPFLKGKVELDDFEFTY